MSNFYSTFSIFHSTSGKRGAVPHVIFKCPDNVICKSSDEWLYLPGQQISYRTNSRTHNEKRFPSRQGSIQKRQNVLNLHCNQTTYKSRCSLYQRPLYYYNEFILNVHCSGYKLGYERINRNVSLQLHQLTTAFYKSILYHLIVEKI